LSNIVQMWKAASRHKRQHWQMAREDAAVSAYAVVERDGAWLVVERGREGRAPDGLHREVAGPFSNSAAWEWIDRHTARRRYGATGANP
jgi:hypothetical protein